MAESAQSSTIPPSKHQNLSENSSDRISNLPESVLHHILSLLPTKEAARTSALSKQWQHFWTWVPNLDLDSREIRQKDKSFEHIVFDVLLSRRSSCITKFTLFSEYECALVGDGDLARTDPDCECGCDFSNFGIFLYAAVSLNVRELDFCLRNNPEDQYENIFQLPRCLFSCKSLVVLKLSGDIYVSIDSSVQFPNLKVLHLHMIKYEDDDTVRNLLSGCPVLDELDVQRFSLDEVLHYEVSSLTLRSLVLLYDVFEPDPLSKMTVNAPALECLTAEYVGPPSVLVLENMDNLVRANVSFMHPSSRPTREPRDVDWRVTLDIFGALRNVQYLEMTFDVVEAPHHYIIPSCNFPVFENVVELKLDGFCCLWRLLVRMLHNCPRLQHLTLVNVVMHSYFSHEYMYCEEPNCWMPPEQVPNCLSSQLTTFKVYRFTPTEPEVECIRYVLKNSMVLHNLTLGLRSEYVSGARQIWPTFERGSGECQLAFEVGQY